MTSSVSGAGGVPAILQPSDLGWRAIKAEIAAMTPPALPSLPGVRALDSLRLRDPDDCRALAAALAGVQAARVHALHGAVVARGLDAILAAWPSKSLADVDRYRETLGGLLWEHPALICDQAVDHLTRTAKRFPARPDLARVLKECAADHAELARLCRLHLEEHSRRALQPPPREALTAEQREADKARVRALLAARFGNDFFKAPEGKRR